ncbi:YadA-like family protein [Glycocaulis sp.]
MPDIFKPRAAGAPRIKWAILTTTALLPLALAAEAVGQAVECPDGTTGPGQQYGTGNAACQTTASAYGQFNLASGTNSSAFGRFNSAHGSISSAFGYQNTASGDLSSAFGVFNTAGAARSSAFGFSSETGVDAIGALAVGGWYDRIGSGNVSPATDLTFALGRYSAAVGSGVRAEGEASSAFGVGTTAGGDFASAFGFLNLAAGDNSAALGYENTTNANFSSAIGYTNTASGEESHALGGFNVASRFQSSAVGYSNIAFGLQSSAFGAFNLASGDYSSAFGYGSIASAEGATAIGFEAVADRAYTVAIGSTGNERNLIHVADGTEDTDAVNLRQLNAAMAGAGGSADLAPLAAALGGGASFAGGVWGAPEYIVLGSSFDNVGGAIGALNTQVEENTTDIADLKAAGGGGTPGGGDPAQAAEIAALRAQLEAMQSALDRLEAGNVTGGTTTDNTNLATGPGSEATGHGDTAFGAGASATGDPSTAVGFQAQASGQHSTAIGGNAEATGNLSVALGQAAVASGANSIALGQGASATFDNSIAIGQGVATTRDNQVAIGSASNTYTLAGINSSASRAAQTGTTFMVTSDAAGNLATMDIELWFARIEGLEASADQRDHRFRTQADGIAVSLALGGAQVIQPGQTFAVSANVGHFDGSNAVGFGAIGRAKENVFVNIGIGAGSRTGAVAGRAGVSWGW